MPSFAEVLSQGTLAAWLYLPTAVLLGALHGLEPGHSKTMMAAFIVAVRGTVPQAVLLGLSAMLSHTAVIWVLGLGALTWGDALIGEHAEPVIMLGSGVIVMGLALWMLWQTRRAQRGADGHDHRHAHAHNGAHGHGHHHAHDHHGNAPRDAHGRHHARQIERQFGNRPATTGQVVLFGLTGGLLPCSAAVAVLLMCLQVREYLLGVAMVGAFSVGLGLTLVAVGVLAAWGTQRLAGHAGRLGRIAGKLPYLSGALVFLIGAGMTAAGSVHLGHGHA